MTPIAEATESAESASSSQPFRYVPAPPLVEAQAVIGDKGRLVIPAAIREALNLQPGDRIEMYVENHELHLSAQHNRIARAQERARKLIQPGRSIVDELIAERRAEALAEMQD